MFDLKAIRDNPEAFDTLWAKRGLEPLSKKILDQDKLIRKAMQVVQEAEAARNKASKQIGAAMGKGDKEEAERLKTEVSGAKNVIAAMGAQVESEKGQLDNLLASLPNVPFENVPDGEDEDDNVELSKWGTPKTFDFDVKAHDDLGTDLGLMDFETAAKMSGSRFVVLRGALSRMDRALAALMLDMQTAEGFEETSPPLIVRQDALFGTGQLPKFMEDLYLGMSEGERTKLSNNALSGLNATSSQLGLNPDKNLLDLINETYAVAETQESFFLIPTAEVSLTNTVRESIIEGENLPIRLTAHTPCFRSEAGSAGRDTKGMIRQHQFNKVELVTICKPEDSEAEHLNILRCAELVLQKLELPYRVVELCTGDLGFGARKSFDIEVWLPSQDTYREISSISNCGDFQARRMNARYKHAPKDNRFVHTLNGSGLAVGRTLVAVLENYQNADGTITVPKALVPYMGGLETIG